MQRKKIVAIEISVLILIWLIVAVSCSAYVFNEKPEDIEDPISNLPCFPLSNSKEDSQYWIEPAWNFTNTDMEVHEK